MMTISVTLAFGKILNCLIPSPTRILALRDTIPQSTRPISRAFLEGFKLSLEDSRFEVLVPRLDTVEFEWRSVAYEGAGLGLTVLDGLLPWKKRFKAFAHG